MRIYTITLTSIRTNPPKEIEVRCPICGEPYWIGFLPADPAHAPDVVAYPEEDVEHLKPGVAFYDERDPRFHIQPCQCDTCVVCGHHWLHTGYFVDIERNPVE